MTKAKEQIKKQIIDDVREYIKTLTEGKPVECNFSDETGDKVWDFLINVFDKHKLNSKEQIEIANKLEDEDLIKFPCVGV